MPLRHSLPLLLIGFLLLAATGGALAQGTAPAAPNAPAVLAGTGFSYQGELRDGGGLVTATCGFEFRLFDAASSGTQQGSPQAVGGVTVSAGRFTVTLNGSGQFGARAFDGSARWLAISVRCPDSGLYTPLSPRQPVTPAPLALALPGLRTEQHPTSPNVVGGHISNTVSGGVYAATIGGGGLLGQPNSVGGSFGTVSGGLGNTASGQGATIGGGGWNGTSAQGNLALGTGSTVGGGFGHRANGYGATIGGGQTNVVTTTADFGTVAGGGGNVVNNPSGTVGGGGGNVVGGDFGTVAGGGGNDVLSLGGAVGGGSSNTVDTFSQYATVAGGRDNLASAGGATVGGGGHDGSSANGNQALGSASTVGGGWGNTANDAYDTVAGGRENLADGLGAAVGGGLENIASGAGATVAGGGWDGADFAGNQALATSSAIGGGSNNVVTATASFGVAAGGQNNTVNGQHAVVGGGRENTAGFFWSTVSGGYGNTASGEGAAVPGGRDNDATGAHSLAAGRNAQALHAGAFVWNCDDCPVTDSSAIDQFIANAEGGFWLGGRGAGSTTGPNGAIDSSHFISTSTGAYLSTVGVWADVSDRNAKTSFAPVDGPALLEALMGLPVESWRYRVDDSGARHIGPTAQDFHAAFGVGESDTHLAALDTSGVALAAIQGLYTVVLEKDAALAEQSARIAALEETVAALEADVETVRRTVSSGETSHRDVSTGGYGQLLPWLPWALVAGLGLLNVGGAAGYALARKKNG